MLSHAEGEGLERNLRNRYFFILAPTVDDVA